MKKLIRFGLALKVTSFTAAPFDVRRGLPRRRSGKRHPAYAGRSAFGPKT
jgi:hypothetical protein